MEHEALEKCHLHQQCSSSSQAAHKGPFLVNSIPSRILAEAMQACMLSQMGLVLLCLPSGRILQILTWSQ